MITYETAVKLKESGFLPKEGEYPRYYYVEKGRFGFFTSSSEHEKDAVYIPTLSELIEACGLKFGSLVKTWTGFSAIGDGDCHAYGPTSEEAVSSLYLELHK